MSPVAIELEDPPPKKDRVKVPPAFGEKGYLRWRAHQAIGGERDVDKKLRRRAAAVASSGVALFFALQFWGVLKPLLTEIPKQMQANADAVHELAEGVKALAAANDRVISLALETVKPDPAPLEGPRPRRFKEGEPRR